MNTRTLILLGSLLPLAACDFDPKDIGDPSGSTIDSAESTAGYSSDGPSTSNGSATSTTGVDPTVATSTTGVDPTATATGTTGDESTSNGSTTTGADPTVSTATGTTGDESTSNGSSTGSTSTTTNGTADTGTSGEPSTTTSTGGEEPGPVMCVGDPKTFPAFDEQCDSKADCAAVLHTIDCCGSEKILGINKNAVGEFDEAEAACDQQYPECDCLPNPPIAEDGNSVLDPSEAQLACNAGVCETFVF